MIQNSVRYSDLETRLDADFYKPKYVEVERILNDLEEQGKAVRLKDLSSEIRKGIFDIKANKYVEDGVPFVRVSDIKNLSLDDSDMVEIPKKFDEENPSTSLGPNDIVIAKSGTLGRSGYVPEDIPRCNVSQDIIGVRTNEDVNSKYIAAFLETKFGKYQMQRAGSQQTHPHLNLSRARDLLVFHPSEEFQRDISDMVEKSRDSELESKKLLEKAEDDLLGLLGVEVRSDRQQIYTTKFQDLSEDNRVDAEYYNPKYKEMLNRVKESGYDLDSIGKIDSMFKFSNDKINPEKHPDTEFKYVTISSVNPHTGEIVDHDLIKGHNAPSRARMAIKTNDVLVPYLSGSSDAVTIVPEELDGAIATTGYYVIRPLEGIAEAIFIMMRSPVIQYQIEQKTSGAVMTSINKSDFKRIQVPLIPKSDQTELADIVRESIKRRRDSRQSSTDAVSKVRKKIEEAHNVS